jgi:hypothetical protein
MLNKNFVYAVVGASNNHEKYGYKVVPINPHEQKILNLKVYENLSEVPFKIDVVIFVVPPNITEKILEEVKRLQIKNVWMQPGSESQKAIKFCEDNNLNYVANSCIMIERSKI